MTYGMLLQNLTFIIVFLLPSVKPIPPSCLHLASYPVRQETKLQNQTDPETPTQLLNVTFLGLSNYQGGFSFPVRFSSVADDEVLLQTSS